MNAVTSVYRRCDAWAKGLSRGAYAALLGISGATGVLLVGFLFGEFTLWRALAMGLVFFGLEYAFGKFQG